jgi:hypothetical protein
MYRWEEQQRAGRSPMREYGFTLRFALPSTAMVPDDAIERLGEAGCDDALIGVGCAGRIALEFARSAECARAAVLSAIRDVRKALPEAELVEVTPDIVGITDLAQVVGCSRQNMRKLLVGLGAGAPPPVHEGNSSIWHLATVLDWLAREKRYSVSADLMELSEVAMKVNGALDAFRTDRDTQEELRVLLAQ